jgi:hypothetical protein
MSFVKKDFFFQLIYLIMGLKILSICFMRAGLENEKNPKNVGFYSTAVKYRTVLGMRCFAGRCAGYRRFWHGQFFGPSQLQSGAAVSAVQAAQPAEDAADRFAVFFQARCLFEDADGLFALEKFLLPSEKPVGVRYPTDRLFITQERKSFQDAKLSCAFRLDLDVPVLAAHRLIRS